jgi:uncharacterized protein YjgD (DUF1641 family)
MEYLNFIECVNTLVSNKGVKPFYIDISVKDAITENIKESIFNNKDLFVSELNKLINSLKRDGNFKTLYRYCNDTKPKIFENIELNDTPLNFKYNKPDVIPSEYQDFIECLNTLVSNKGVKPFYIDKYIKDAIIKNIEEPIFNNKDLFVSELNKLINTLKRDGNFKTLYRYCNDTKPKIFENIELNDTPLNFKLMISKPPIISSNNLSAKEIKEYIEAKLPDLIFPPKIPSNHILNDIFSTIENNKNPTAEYLKDILLWSDNCCDYPVLVVYLKLNGKQHETQPRNINNYIDKPPINYNDYILYLKKNHLNKYLKYKMKYLKLKKSTNIQ